MCYYKEKGGFIVKQKDWKIIYTSYKGIAKHAVNLLSKEAGRYIIRENGLYRIYVLPCEKEGCEVSKNAFFVGCYNESNEIKKYVEEKEVPKEGFLVKVIKNPDDEEGRFVILTAHNEQELFYSVVSFFDDYLMEHPHYGGANPMPDTSFNRPLDEYSYSEVPQFKTRSIFTWGHSINDYRQYIDNMARLKFNELIIWNTYIPINIDDIIDYAHSYGIKVVLGYSWGWREIGQAKEIKDEDIENVKKIAVEKFKETYTSINCDGIYFQTFTEREDEMVGGKLISQLATDMVNDIADELWKIKPDLRLLFGLHATSVKKHLDVIAQVNPRIELYWEDCGDYPFGYGSKVTDREKHKETLDFIEKVLSLREGKGVVLVFKGIMMLDWNQFALQGGPYVMGQNSKVIASHDKGIRASGWRHYTADWVKHGEDAFDMIEHIKKHMKDDVSMCLAGTFDGGIYLPMAICAEMFRNSAEDYNEVVKKVIRRDSISFDENIF